LDILELYAFVFPTTFCVPTVHGVTKSLGLQPPQEDSDYPLSLIECADILLSILTTHSKKEKLLEIAGVMGHNGRSWGWTPYVFAAMGQTYDAKTTISSTRNTLNVWSKLPEWTEAPPQPPPSHHSITGDEVRSALQSILTTKQGAESRAEQMNYATRLAEGFKPPDVPDHPHVILAEAGTGVGKTLGYLAPATVWSSKNDGAVLVSTYTKNLQRQISEEFKRIYPDPDVRSRKVTVRKGRENYICLLNFEELAAASGTAQPKGTPIAAGLMARWVMETEDGDLTGNSFHGWLPGLLGKNTTLALADHRGECIFSGCDHYHRCFGENALRKASRTPLVIANHAVVMIKAAHGDDDLPHHLIFDEGHHLFDAAESSFCAALTGVETHDLRRWLLGPESGRKSRARGLKKRVEDLLTGDESALRLMEDIMHHARFLPTHDWLQRLRQGNVIGSAEECLRDVYQQVWARADGKEGPYSLETHIFPVSDPLQISAQKLLIDMKALRQPITRMAARLRQKLTEETDTLAPDTRNRLDAVASSLERRVHSGLTPWVELLKSICDGVTTTEMVDWIEIDRNENNIFDVGLHRHYVDPTKPFAESLKSKIHSMIVTSATLKDKNGEDWTSADVFSGAQHLSEAPTRFSIGSPYDYIQQTRVFIITDVKKTDVEQLAAAYRALFEAAGGGCLGLFTSIQRLIGVQKRIVQPLSEADITLYAQHVDGIDTGTLVDMFRDDTHSCLLGTDAVRDGVDVPGESLRLIAFDRVPWPRATLLHKARKQAFGGADYDDRLTRLKLKQAFGRLIRTATDRGVFVMLDSAIPTRLMDAFPEGVIIERIGIAEAIQKSKEFLKTSCFNDYDILQSIDKQFEE
ncbi:MAG: ATP-dependent DNA helicase, partial [Pseudomonadota bacterium]